MPVSDNQAALLEGSPRREVVIGTSSACDLRVADRYVSPRHARITEYPADTYWLEDLNSLVGTRVWLDQSTPFVVRPGVRFLLVPGDVIALSRTMVWRWRPRPMGPGRRFAGANLEPERNRS